MQDAPSPGWRKPAKGGRIGGTNEARAHGKTFMYSRRMSGMHSSRFVLIGLLAAITTCTVGCRRRVAPTQEKGTAASALVEDGVTSALAPLQASSRVESLVVRGHPDATLLVPSGVTRATPVVAILLPTSDEMVERCKTLGRLIATNHFVLCQSARVEQQSRVPTAAGNGLVDAALRAAVRNTKNTYGDYVSLKELALIGIGEGAEAVVPIVRRSPEFFPRVALIDGGFTFWSSVDSARFAAAGAKAFLARCAEARCRNEAMRVVATVKTSGTPARLDPAPSAQGVAGAPAELATPVPELVEWLLAVELSPRAAQRGSSSPSTPAHP